MTKWECGVVKVEYAEVEAPTREYYGRSDWVVNTESVQYSGWDRVVDYLDALGEQGWELVSTVSIGDSFSLFMHFKRPRE